MVRSIIAALVIAVPLGGAAQAQEWSANSFDTGALIHGAALSPGGAFVLSCTVPSPQGRPLIETGDHEALRTDAPYGLAVSFSTDMIDPFGVDHSLPAPRMILDGQAYALPSMTYSDFYGAWTGLLRFDTPGVLELFQTTSLGIDPGRGTVHEFTVAGLSAAMDQGLGPCLERWFNLGNPLPPRVLAYVSTGVSPDQPTPTPVPLADEPVHDLPDGLRPAPRFEVPDVAPQAAFDHIYAMCEGPFDISDPSAIVATDIDGDGAADFILNYTGVHCNGGLTGRAFCGAANCSIDVFLSSRGYAAPEEFLGIELIPVRDNQDRVGLLLGATPFVCADGFCDTPFYWDGDGFRQ